MMLRIYVFNLYFGIFITNGYTIALVRCAYVRRELKLLVVKLTQLSTRLCPYTTLYCYIVEHTKMQKTVVIITVIKKVAILSSFCRVKNVLANPSVEVFYLFLRKRQKPLVI